jgi:DNA-binding transcriptional regulator GbsR (MarR family)
MTKYAEKQDNENYSKNFTRVPNIVFASYKYLTKEEKFLYCTLRQVYWDMKPRFVSLRELSEATGYAVGALSKMLPRLHTCGLIHSEIRHEKGKDGKAKGHAKYHITIPDIWELNRKYFEASPETQVTIDPSLKLAQEIVHQMNNSKSKDCSRNVTELFTKCDSSVHEMNASVPFREQSQAQVKLPKDNNKDTLKEREKDREEPNVVKEISPSPVPEVSLSLSPQKNEKKTDPLEEWYSLFDRLLQEKGYPSNFRVPRNEKNAAAIQDLISMNATSEQATFVLNHIWNDKDPFWRQHRGKITTIASQFTTRVCEMNVPAQKQRTSSGLPNWTADKTMGAPTVSDRAEKPEKPVVKAEVVNEPSRTAKTTTVPVQPALPVGYTRLKIDKPARPRTLFGRVQEQNDNNDKKGL